MTLCQNYCEYLYFNYYLEDQVARYSDANKNNNLNNSSSTLIHTLFLLLFGLLMTRIITIEELQ